MSVLTNAINANATTPLSTTQGGSGVSNPTAHGILVAEGASAFATKVLTNGQLLIGSTGVDPVGAALTAGTGISITNGAGSITITNTETSSTMWTVETAGPVTIAPGNGYASNSATQIVYTLPSTAAVGDTYQVNSMNTGGFQVAQNAGQSVIVGNETTTAGTGGSITSASTTGDWVEIVCVVANTSFIANVKQGQVTIV
jgi:hypothetical protein